MEATKKQINFIEKLKEQLKEASITIDLAENPTIKDASLFIGKALKALKNAGNVTVKKEEKKELVFQAFELITDYQSKYDIISRRYTGGLDSWNNTPSNREYRDKHIIGDTIVLKTKDGKYLLIDDEKPSIEKTLYYDDETKEPDNTFENFKLYNLKYFNKNFENLKYLYKCNYGDVIAVSNRIDFDNEANFIRILTDEEKQELQNIYKMQLDNYTKRLENYWKKYQSKIYWMGYWVNR